MTYAVISIHDVAPATLDECDRLLTMVEASGARSSLLVVPGPWRPPVATADVAFVEWLQAAATRGHEVVAHGWEHRAVDDPTFRRPAGRRAIERVLTRGCAEFAALGGHEAERRAGWSRDALLSMGFSPEGFVAPGWSLSKPASDALARVGFGYTTTRSAVVDLTGSPPVRVPAVCHRPDSALSGVGAWMVAAVVEQRCRSRRPIRLALHPADVHDDELQRSTTRALEALDASTLELMTYAELVDANRRLHAPRSADRPAMGRAS